MTQRVVIKGKGTIPNLPKKPQSSHDAAYQQAKETFPSTEHKPPEKK
jgi:hypothetical protein